MQISDLRIAKVRNHNDREQLRFIVGIRILIYEFICMQISDLGISKVRNDNDREQLKFIVDVLLTCGI